MAIAEERLPVSDLTQLSSVVADDMLLTQTSGSNGDVMLTPISEIISRILEPIFAQLDSPALTGEPTAPSIEDNTAEDDRIATTAFVQLIAALKANTASPEFTGQAHFADHVPTTETGEGETVALATAADIQNLNSQMEDAARDTSELAETVSQISNKLIAAGTRIAILENSNLSNVSLTIANASALYSFLLVEMACQGWSNTYLIPTPYATSVWAHFGYHNGGYCTIAYTSNKLTFKDASFATGMTSATVRVYGIRK